MQLEMLAVVLFTASDDGVSKFDRSTLPQQNIMEFFIFGFDEPEKLCGSRENPNEGCRWRNATCNADREVNKFVRGEMVEWLVQGYVHSVATSIPAHAV